MTARCSTNSRSMSRHWFHEARLQGLMVLGVFVTLATTIHAQDNDAVANQDSKVDELSQQVTDLTNQVDRLNNRVATLERLLLTRIIEASPEGADYLQAELDVAEDRLEHSTRLFEKGYISELQLQGERFSVERARLRLELAQMAADAAEFSSSIQLFEAQAKLDLALQRLEQSERLSARGYVTPAQLRADQLDVDRARQQVEAIKEELSKTNDDE